MKLEANSYISTMVEEQKAMMKKFSTSPHDFFTDITRRLYDNNESIKKIASENDFSDFDKDWFNIFIIIFSDKDFLQLVADVIMKDAKNDSNRTLLSLVDIVMEIAKFTSIYKEHIRIFVQYKKVLLPLRNIYINLYMLFTAAEIDLFQKVPYKDCPFTNLRNWLRKPKNWTWQLAMAYKYGNT